MRINTYVLSVFLLLTTYRMLVSSDSSTPLRGAAARSSDVRYVTPDNSSVNGTPLSAADTLILNKNMDEGAEDRDAELLRQHASPRADTLKLSKKAEARVADFPETRKKLLFLSINSPHRKRDIAGKSPVHLRAFDKERIRQAVQKAHRKAGSKRTAAWDALVALCNGQGHEGYGEWALYFAVTENAPAILRELLSLRYNPLQLFPVETPPLQTHEMALSMLESEALAVNSGTAPALDGGLNHDNPTESLLDIALKKGYGEVAQILMDCIPCWLCNGNEEYPLEKALKEGHGHVVAELVDSGFVDGKYSQEILERLLACAQDQKDQVLIKLIQERLNQAQPKNEEQHLSVGRVIELLPWLGICGISILILRAKFLSSGE